MQTSLSYILNEGLSLGVIQIDMNYNIVSINSFVKRHSKNDWNSLIGQNILEMFPDICSRGKDQYIRKVIEDGQANILSPFIHQYIVPFDIVKKDVVLPMVQETRIYPLHEDSIQTGALIIIRDMTEQLLNENEIASLTMDLNAIRKINQLMVKAEDREELFKGVCSVLINDTDSLLVWIVGVGDFEELYFPVICEGEESRIFTDIISSHRNVQTKLDITRHAIKTGDVAVSFRLENDPAFENWWSLCKDLACQSTLALPLKCEGKIDSVLHIHRNEETTISQESLELFRELANDISFCLDQFYNKELRLEAESILRNEKERLRITLRGIGDGVIATDRDGSVVLVNRVAEELTGWTEQEAIGRNIGDVFHIINEYTRKPCFSPVERVLQTGGIIGLANHTALIAKDGVERVIADSGAPIRDDYGQIIGVVLVFRDISQQSRLAQEMLKIQRLESIGLLAGGIAHDFNNILSVITGNISFAMTRYTNDAELQEVFADVEAATNRAKDLTHQLLTFAKGGAPIKRIISINGIIRESARFVARGSNVRVIFNEPPELKSTSADQGQISQVIQNLVLNSVQAMPEGGEITINAENTRVEEQDNLPIKSGSYIKITIQDNGMGIPPKHMQKVFDPFFTTKQKGSGLGLATAFSIIKRHNGHISAQSIQGEGTTFEVYLPSVEEMEDDVTRKEPGTHQGKGKILVMDDEKPLCKMFDRMFEKLGYNAHFAKNGQEAIIKYREALDRNAPYDLVILDLTIPGGMGGKETVRHLKEIDPNVKAVVSSGYSNDPVMSDYLDYGFAGVMPKPVSMTELVHLLKSILEQ
ncbi:MAG: PAS domain-containing protein [Desulfamplus sp.]|nr:PAS domain-containing protein [Desulfamplus sp.]